MVKDRVKLSGDTGILDDIHKGSAIGNSVVCSQERDQPPESAGLGQHLVLFSDFTATIFSHL